MYAVKSLKGKWVGGMDQWSRTPALLPEDPSECGSQSTHQMVYNCLQLHLQENLMPLAPADTYTLVHKPLCRCTDSLN